MNPLQYTSKEMYSSTELIRKSKKIFEKLQRKEIEKAIILRDGKPGFMLLDFETYEEIMTEYVALKEMLGKNEKPENVIKNDKEDNSLNKSSYDEIEIIEKKIEHNEVEIDDELSAEDVENALAEIEKLQIDDIEEQIEEKPLKDFWE